jgi:hypothetical protein
MYSYLGVLRVELFRWGPQRNKLPHVTFLSVFTSSCTVKKAKERVRHPERMAQESGGLWEQLTVKALVPCEAGAWAEERGEGGSWEQLTV